MRKEEEMLTGGNQTGVPCMVAGCLAKWVCYPAHLCVYMSFELALVEDKRMAISGF